jgi:hypothetical protein
MIYLGHQQPRDVITRSTLIALLLGFPLLPTVALAQTSPQTAAIENAAPPVSPAPAPAPVAGITRQEYMQRAEERAGQRAGARFDQLDANHDGVIDRAEIRAWRSQHPRRAAAQSAQPAPQ